MYTKMVPLVGFEPRTPELVATRSTATPYSWLVGLVHYTWKAKSTYKMSEKLRHDDQNHIILNQDTSLMTQSTCMMTQTRHPCRAKTHP